MKALRIHYNGCHGLVGESLTPTFAIHYASAIGTYFGDGPIVLAGDTRASTGLLHRAVTSALIACGTRVVDLGVCPQPVAQFHIHQNREIKGGIYISGAHAGSDWNGFIVFQDKGLAMNPYEGSELLDIYHSRQFRRMPWDRLGKVERAEPPYDAYLDALLAHIDTAAIARRKPMVVVDSCNGTAPELLDRLAARLGLRLIPLNHVPDGNFPHDPEPRPRNSRQASSLVKGIGADLGICFNCNGVNAALVTETGETLSEEMTFALVANHLLPKHPGAKVVTNLCTSKMIDDIAERHRATLLKAPVGQGDIADMMQAEEALLGGEGVGSVAYAPFMPAFDAFIASCFILEALCQSDGPSSRLVERLPARYHQVKRQIPVAPTKQYAQIDRIRQAFLGENHVCSVDGLRVDWFDGWLHVRCSSTKPMLRIVSESRTREQAEERADQAASIIAH